MAWRDGLPVTGEPVAGARALAYGDGVFRTLLVIDGRAVDAAGQVRHLLRDAAALDLRVADSEALVEQVTAFAAAQGRGALRVTLTRRDTGSGYLPDTDAGETWLHARGLPPHPARCWQQGVELHWSPVLLGVQPHLAGIKHCNRLEQVLASRDWRPGQLEALMCDAEGRVVCGTRSNVFFVIDGVLVTPALRSSGVAGRMRARLIELSVTLGCECEVGTLSPDEVRHASEAFVSNSLVGIWPVRRIGSLQLAAPGPVTQRLWWALEHPWSGT